MKKSDLKTGMIIEREDGSYFRVLLGTPLGDRYIKVGGTKHGSLDNYDNNLRWDLDNIPSKGDIVKVHSPRYSYSMLSSDIDDPDYNTIWERKPNIEIDVFINGKEANLSDISEETLIKLREEN